VGMEGGKLSGVRDLRKRPKRRRRFHKVSRYWRKRRKQIDHGDHVAGVARDREIALEDRDREAVDLELTFLSVDLRRLKSQQSKLLLVKKVHLSSQ